MHREAAFAAVFEVVFQRLPHGAESQFVPRHLVLAEQPRFDGFGAGRERGVEHASAVVKVDLGHPHHVQYREQALQFDVGAGLFHGLARGAVGGAFAEFEKAGRQRPEAVARLDVAPAQQHLIAPHRHRAHHVDRVLVVNLAAGRAGGPGAVVIRRHAVFGGGAADAAMLDAVGREHRRQCSGLPLRGLPCVARAWHHLSLPTIPSKETAT